MLWNLVAAQDPVWNIYFVSLSGEFSPSICRQGYVLLRNSPYLWVFFLLAAGNMAVTVLIKSVCDNIYMPFYFLKLHLLCRSFNLAFFLAKSVHRENNSFSKTSFVVLSHIMMSSTCCKCEYCLHLCTTYIYVLKVKWDRRVEMYILLKLKVFWEAFCCFRYLHLIFKCVNLNRVSRKII